MEKKRADWAQGAVRVLNGKGGAGTLYFAIASRLTTTGRSRSDARPLVFSAVCGDFGILGPKERDSGHDVRRFGEETLFTALRHHNTEAIRASGARRIVTADPHAYNALKHDYRDVPPVEHLSQVVARAVRPGQVRLNPVETGVYTTTIRATSAAITECTTTRATCSIRFPGCGAWKCRAVATARSAAAAEDSRCSTNRKSRSAWASAGCAWRRTRAPA